mgnify:CR=1 FL=1
MVELHQVRVLHARQHVDLGPRPAIWTTHSLELHRLRKGEPYYLAAFLVGAYQETLGALHNLFGDTHAVHISLSADGAPQIDDVICGDTVSEVLSYVQINAKELSRQVAGSYRSLAPRGDGERVPKCVGVCISRLCASPSAVRVWAERVGPAAAAVCIGETTAAEARRCCSRCWTPRRHSCSRC